MSISADGAKPEPEMPQRPDNGQPAGAFPPMRSKMRVFVAIIIFADNTRCDFKVQSFTMAGAMGAIGGMVDCQVKSVRVVHVEEVRLSNLVSARALPPERPV